MDPDPGGPKTCGSGGSGSGGSGLGSGFGSGSATLSTPHLFAGEEVLGLCCGLTADVLDEAVTLALPRHLGDHQEAGRHATITSNIKV